MKNFYDVKSKIEKKIRLLYSGIEWRPYSIIEFQKIKKKKSSSDVRKFG